ncbi:hypothetical protein [Kitasatospora sp. NPDC057015]|uniref:hypothetical protein n=1 Tax=Kitasatospora sp. NPDC057015 TaxID=3346001 RepID=UPI0036281725
MSGAWRITVIGKDADFDQRAVVRTPYGTWVLPGRVGAHLDVPAQEWELTLEHRAPGRGWQPNVRVLPGPLQDSGGHRSRIVRSKDVDWAGGDPAERNFTLQLACLDARAPREVSAPAPIPAATPVARTSSDPHLGVGGVGGAVGAVRSTGGSEQRHGQGYGQGYEQGRRTRGAAEHAGGRPAPGGRGAAEAWAGLDTAGETSAGWRNAPPVPEGWEYVPVPDSRLGPGETRAIRPKTRELPVGQQALHGLLAGQEATRAVPARRRADSDTPVEQDTVLEVLAGRETVRGVPAGREGNAERTSTREPSAERVVPAVWNTGEDLPAGPEDSRDAAGGWPDWEPSGARRTVQGGPTGAETTGSRSVEAVRGVPVSAPTAARAVPAAEVGPGVAAVEQGTSARQR